MLNPQEGAIMVIATSAIVFVVCMLVVLNAIRESRAEMAQLRRAREMRRMYEANVPTFPAHPKLWQEFHWNGNAWRWDGKYWSLMPLAID